MAWTPGGYPLPPTNPAVVSPFIPGALDLRWDDPSPLEGNEGWDILGVNVYRSDAIVAAVNSVPALIAELKGYRAAEKFLKDFRNPDG
jgi:hypothetical protein